jgi:hypothetical protein
MKMPWEGRTGLAKATAILATGFAISLGLCGLNLAGYAAFSHGGDSVFLIPGYLELAGMIVCAAGLVFVLLLFVLKQIFKPLRRPGRPDKENQP